MLFIRFFIITLISFATSSAFADFDKFHQGDQKKYSQFQIDQGGQVIPSFVRPYGLSLYDIAKMTAAFNISDRNGIVPSTPFQILYDSSNNPTKTLNVRSSKILYVPIMYNDDSLPVIGHLPDVRNRSALLYYFYSQKEFGAVYTKITVDGRANYLGFDYVAGVYFPQALADGAHNYMTSAAFLSPLKKGKHTVEISAKFTGYALKVPPISDYFPNGVFEFKTTYTVISY